MRRGLSPSKAKEELSYRKQRDEPRRMNPSVNYWKYFCHYNNAVYQGGMNAYKKHGKGLLLHDDGSAVVSEYLHDTISGHNIIFRENSISSLLYKSNSEYQIVYKVGKSIIKIPFAENSQKPHGLGVLIDYQLGKIYQLIFKRGALVEKILHLNRKNNHDVFVNNTVSKLIGLKHQQAFDLSFQKPQTMHVRYSNNRLIIGYHDQKGDIKGLAFQMYAQNVDISGRKGLYTKYIQRGYYKNSQLQTYGQKYFSNGNKYIGQFLQGQFDGDGILLCPQEMKWVYGQFKDGKLNQVKDSNNKKYTDNNFQMWNKGLLHIHQKYRQRYIDFDIDLPQELYCYKILKQTLKMPVTEVDPDYQQSMREDQQRMSRIQQTFLQGHPGDSQRSYVDLQLQKHYLVKSNKNLRPFDSHRINNKKYEEQAPKTTKHSKKAHFQDRIEYPIERIIETPIDRIQTADKVKVKTPKNTKSQQREAQQFYRMKDPFQIQLFKVPYEQSHSKQAKRSKDMHQIQERKTKPIFQADKYPKQSQGQRKKSPTNSFQSDRSYDKFYSHKAQLERKKQKYRMHQREDQQYINYLKGGIQRSPLHRNYYQTPPKYESYPHRYNGKIINKEVFNYNQPTAESLVRYSPQRYSSQRYPSKDSSLDRNISRTINRSSPYKSIPNTYNYRR